MTDKAKKIIAREGLILVSVLLVFLAINNVWSPMRVAHYRKECQRLEEANNIKTIRIDYRLWGGTWDKTSWDTPKDSEDDFEPLVEVVDRNGKVNYMDKNKKLWGADRGIDWSSMEDVDKLSKEENERRNKICKSRKEKLKIAQRVVMLQNGSYNPPLNNVESILVAIPFVFLIVAYPIYLFIRLIIFIKWAFKTKKITKEKVIKYTKIAFSKDVLIRVILILGIIFLCISLLRSCGFMETHRSLRL